MELNEAVGEASGDEAEVKRLGQEVRDQLQGYLNRIEDHFNQGRTEEARYFSTHKLKANNETNSLESQFA
jgi:hypothetical protein